MFCLDCVRRQKLSWKITEDITHNTTSPTSRRDVVGWVDHAIAEMEEEEQIVKNVRVKTARH